mmetsp:Transcript_103104/g.162961  ORF Transcript_103104/g.162961 Transcript_103104/m.162961 type:complete len:191 (+) Transcript_103104:73-645(+)
MSDQPNPNEGMPPESPISGTMGKSMSDKSERKVGFNTSANTLAAYTPSNSSEDWDPNAESESEDDGKAPEELGGLLWKKSPSVLKFGKYQQRYFRVKAGKITWWQGHEEAGKRNKIKGYVDLKSNPSQIVPASSGSKFALEPKGGRWVGECNFTGSKEGRKFELDAAGSEHTRADWIKVIEAHQAYASSV